MPDSPYPSNQYVHLVGRALIGMNEAGQFTVTLLGEDRQPIPGSIPIALSDQPFELLNMHLVVLFKPEEREVYEPTLNASTHALIQFEQGVPKARFRTCMTSTIPPDDCSNMAKPPVSTTPAPPRTFSMF